MTDTQLPPPGPAPQPDQQAQDPGDLQHRIFSLAQQRASYWRQQGYDDFDSQRRALSEIAAHVSNPDRKVYEFLKGRQDQYPDMATDRVMSNNEWAAKHPESIVYEGGLAGNLRHSVLDPIGDIGWNALQAGFVDPVVGAANLLGAGINHIDLKSNARAAFRKLTGQESGRSLSEVARDEMTIAQRIREQQGLPARIVRGAADIGGQVAGILSPTGIGGQVFNLGGKVAERLTAAATKRILGREAPDLALKLARSAGGFGTYEALSQPGKGGKPPDGWERAEAGAWGAATGALSDVLGVAGRYVANKILVGGLRGADEATSRRAAEGLRDWIDQTGNMPAAGEPQAAYARRVVGQWVDDGMPGSGLTARQIIATATEGAMQGAGFTLLDADFRKDAMQAVMDGDGDAAVRALEKLASTTLGVGALHAGGRLARIRDFQRSQPTPQEPQEPGVTAQPQRPAGGEPSGGAPTVEDEIRQTGIDAHPGARARPQTDLPGELSNIEFRRPPLQAPPVSGELRRLGWQPAQLPEPPPEEGGQAPAPAPEDGGPPAGAPPAEKPPEGGTVELPGTGYRYQTNGTVVTPGRKLREALGLPESLPQQRFDLVLHKASQVNALQAKAMLPGTEVSVEGQYAQPPVGEGDGKIQMMAFGDVMEKPLSRPWERWHVAEAPTFRPVDDITPQQTQAVAGLQTVRKLRPDLWPDYQSVLDSVISVFGRVDARKDPSVAEALDFWHSGVLQQHLQGTREQAGQAIMDLAAVLTTKSFPVVLQDQEMQRARESLPEWLREEFSPSEYKATQAQQRAADEAASAQGSPPATAVVATEPHGIQLRKSEGVYTVATRLEQPPLTLSVGPPAKGLVVQDEYRTLSYRITQRGDIHIRAATSGPAVTIHAESFTPEQLKALKFSEFERGNPDRLMGSDFANAVLRQTGADFGNEAEHGSPMLQLVNAVVQAWHRSQRGGSLPHSATGQLGAPSNAESGVVDIGAIIAFPVVAPYRVGLALGDAVRDIGDVVTDFYASSAIDRAAKRGAPDIAEFAHQAVTNAKGYLGSYATRLYSIQKRTNRAIPEFAREFWRDGGRITGWHAYKDDAAGRFVETSILKGDETLQGLPDDLEQVVKDANELTREIREDAAALDVKRKGKDGKQEPVSPVAHGDVMTRQATQDLRDILARKAGPAWEKLNEVLAEWNGFTIADTKAKWTEARSLKILDPIELKRSFKVFPDAIEVNGKIIELLHSDPFAQVTQMVHRAAMRLGVIASPFGQDLPREKTEGGYETDEPLPYHALVDKIAQERGRPAADAVAALIRALHGLPSQRLSNFIEPSHPAYRFAQAANAMLSVWAALKMSMGFVMNAVEPWGAPAARLGPERIGRGHMDLAGAFMRGELGDLIQQAVDDGILAHDMRNWKVQGESGALAKTRAVARDVSQTALIPFQFFQHIGELIVGAATRHMVDEMKAGRGTQRDVSHAMTLGFDRAKAEAMRKGEGSEDNYNRLLRNTVSSLMGGASQATAEQSAFSRDRVLPSWIRFQGFFTKQVRTLRKIGEEWDNATTAAQRARAVQRMVEMMLANAITGTVGAALSNLVTDGFAGLARWWRELTKDPLHAGSWALLSTLMGGAGTFTVETLKTLFTGSGDEKERAIGHTVAHFFTPTAFSLELGEFVKAMVGLTDPYSEYNGKSPVGKIGIGLMKLSPLVRTVGEGLFGISAIGLADDDKVNDARRSYYGWMQRHAGIKFDPQASEEKDIAFQSAMRAMVANLRQGRMMNNANVRAELAAALKAKDSDAVAASLRARRITSSQDFKKLTPAQRKSMREFMGDSWELIQHEDAVLDSMADTVSGR